MIKIGNCSNCKFYSAIEFNPAGWENSDQKPESEGTCIKLSKTDSCAGIILTPEMGNEIWVTSNFGCIHFQEEKIK